MLFRTVVALSALSLAACSSGSAVDEAISTSSNFALLNAQNQIVGSATADASVGGSLAIGGIGQIRSGYAYLVESEGDSIRARSSLVNPGGITTKPTTGTARYTADFELSEVRDAAASMDVTGASGGLPINIAMATGQVTGSGDGLTVAGKMNATGPGFTGKASWRGLDSAMKGRADNTRIIGAFNGAGDNAAYAGGFIGRPR